MSNDNGASGVQAIGILEVAELLQLVTESQTNGGGLEKKLAAHTLDLRVATLWTEGITLRQLADALGVKESSIHTRVVRVRNLELEG